MRAISLPIFIFRLACANIPTAVLLGVAKIKSHTSIALSLMMGGVILVTVITHLSPTRTVKTSQQINSSLTQNTTKLILSSLEEELSKQPTHRDLLLNAAAAAALLGHQERAQEYRQRAISLDPNNPLLTR